MSPLTICNQELEEANSLCLGNRIKIERKNQYVQVLQELPDSNHISYPDEMQFNLIKGLTPQPDPNESKGKP